MSFDFCNIRHAYGAVTALEDVSFSAAAGQVTCLLGPSGCGKTTLLSLAAGILELQAGELWLDGALLATPGKAPPPEHRPIGLVFQEGALFPHLTVAQNIGFGIKEAGARAQLVPRLLHQIGLSHYGARYPHTLSGGQAQRVALARALAPAPRVLLLDEPFANIDIQRRRSLREETRLLLKATGGVAIMVTHDPDEALELGDQIAVLEAGKLVQIDTPDALYRSPGALLVATLVGEGQPASGVVEGGKVSCGFGTWDAACLSASTQVQTGAVDLALRADIFDVAADDDGLPLVDRRAAGPYQRLGFRAPSGEVLIVHVPNDMPVPDASHMRLTPQAGSVHAFAARSPRRK